jgi:hypothetical protein
MPLDKRNAKILNEKLNNEQISILKAIKEKYSLFK